MSENKEHKLIQSYVADKFFVSTAFRRSSGLHEIWYYETMAWRWNPDTKEMEESYLIQTDSGRWPEKAMKVHLGICESLRTQGKYEEDSE